MRFFGFEANRTRVLGRKKMRSFKGGVFLAMQKQATADKPIEEIPLPSEVVIPLTQHVGVPNDSLVSAGDRVIAGQKIAEAQGFVSAPVHASVSGEVVAIEPRSCLFGAKVASVIIVPDGRQKETKINTPGTLEADEIISLVKEAGIVGLGGATFPTHVKLTKQRDKPVDMVIVNGCECEPFLTGDYRQMLEETDDLVDGTNLIMEVMGANDAVIAVERNSLEVIERIKKHTAGLKNVGTTVVPTKFPIGAEHMLVKAITGREIPSGGLPVDVRVLVQNAATTIAISRAVRYGQPLIEKVLTVSGHAIKEPKNLRVKIGTPLDHVINACGGFSEEPYKIIVGGPMTGFAQFDLSVPVVKGTLGIVALTREEISLALITPTTCIRCARCVECCPIHLMPNYYAVYGEINDWEMVESFNVEDCIECGNCSYVCPARIPHIQYIRIGKAKVLAKKAK